MNNFIKRSSLEKEGIKLEQLDYIVKHLGQGTHSCGKDKGFITIEDDGDIMWTSGRSTHNSIESGLPCVNMCIGKTSIHSIFKSAVTMWPVYDDIGKLEVVRFLTDRIELALERNYLKEPSIFDDIKRFFNLL